MDYYDRVSDRAIIDGVEFEVVHRDRTRVYIQDSVVLYGETIPSPYYLGYRLLGDGRLIDGQVFHI